MKKIFFTVFLIFALIFAGCGAQPIKEIKKQEMVGEKVTVEGTVKNTVKLGKLSGYTLVDANGDEIGISSQKLPTEGKTATVTGTLIKDTILGYYIQVADEDRE
jgi:hypothetical protein